MSHFDGSTGTRSLFCVTAIALSVLLVPSCAGAAEVLDQQNIFASSIADSPSDAQEFAQSFTVGVDGILSRIEVFLAKTNPGNNVVLSLYTTAGGIPSSVVATASLPPTAVAGLQSFISFDVSSFQLAVSASDVLAFALKKDGFDGGPYIMPFTTTNTYAAGSSYRRTLSVPPGAWTIQDGRDYSFKTYVVTEESPVLLGDYNQNGTIDVADYTVWRDLFQVDDAILPNDPTPNVIDESDYQYWKDHFGETLNAPGSAAAIVPEASSRTLLVIGLAIITIAAATMGHRVRDARLAVATAA